MTLYPFETQLVLSDDGERVLLTNAQVTFYDPSDTGFNSPLSIVDNAGIALSNPVHVTPQGFIPAFQASVPQVMWLGGGYYGYYDYQSDPNKKPHASRADRRRARAQATR